MKNLYLVVIVTLTCTAYAIGASMSITDGVVESQFGGFKFPDGTVQSSAAFPAASTCTAITYVPYVISVEGVYCFTGHLETSMTSGTAITINADNVTINMNGWKLDGLGAGDGTQTFGIYAYLRKNITIRNGTIRGFEYGIVLNDSWPYTTSQGHLIEDIRADMNTKTGFLIRGSGNTVRHNQIIATGGSTVDTYVYGILLGGPGGRVLNNDISTATSGSGYVYGLYLSYAHGAVVEGNRIDEVSSGTGNTYGMLFQNSADILAVGNRISSAKYGIYYSVSTGKYMDNLTSSVVTPFIGGIAVGYNS